MTMTLISTVNSSGNSTLTFSSIPQTGTDLLLVASLRSDYAGTDQVRIAFNTGSFTTRYLNGTGTAVSSTTAEGSMPSTAGWYSNINGANSSSSVFTTISVYIPNYTGTTVKSGSIEVATENSLSTTAFMRMIAGQNSQTTGITTVTLGLYNGPYANGSTASLYKITKGSGGATIS